MIIALASGKGGVGKSVSALALALALHQLGKQVLLVDGNLAMPNLALMLGCPSVPVALNHVLLGRKSIHEAIYAHSSGLKVLPASFFPEVRKPSLKALRQLKGFDFVILDSAPGAELEPIRACHQLIAVTTPELPAIAATLKTLKLAQALKKRALGVIVTRCSPKDRASLETVQSMLELPLLATIPEDEAVKQAIAARRPLNLLFPRSKAALAYKQLAAKLAGQSYKEERSFWQRLLSLFR